MQQHQPLQPAADNGPAALIVRMMLILQFGFLQKSRFYKINDSSKCLIFLATLTQQTRSLRIKGDEDFPIIKHFDVKEC